jgi:hypothetical protein
MNIELNTELLERATALLPVPVRNLLETAGEAVTVAGGFLRALASPKKEVINDIDLFFSRESAVYDALDYLRAYPLIVGASEHKTPRSISLRAPGGAYPLIQLITHDYFVSNGALLDSFDYTISKACLWYNPNRSCFMGLMHHAFISDVTCGRLVYTNPVRKEQPASALLRMLKFYNKGYTVDNENMAAILARVCALEPEQHANLLRALSVTGTIPRPLRALPAPSLGGPDATGLILNTDASST